MKKTWRLAVLVALGCLACSSRPAAMDVCKKLEAAGVATGCKEAKATGINATAQQVTEFEVTGLAGQKGFVLAFDQQAAYDNTVRSYSELGSRNADHRAGNRQRLVFVTLPAEAPAELGERAEKLVSEL